MSFMRSGGYVVASHVCLLWPFAAERFLGTSGTILATKSAAIFSVWKVLKVACIIVSGAGVLIRRLSFGSRGRG